MSNSNFGWEVEGGRQSSFFSLPRKKKEPESPPIFKVSRLNQACLRNFFDWIENEDPRENHLPVVPRRWSDVRFILFDSVDNYGEILTCSKRWPNFMPHKIPNQQRT